MPFISFSPFHIYIYFLSDLRRGRTLSTRGREALPSRTDFDSAAVWHRSSNRCCCACVIRARRTGLNYSALPAAPLFSPFSSRADLVYIRSPQVERAAALQSGSLVHQRWAGKSVRRIRLWWPWRWTDWAEGVTPESGVCPSQSILH